jgi:hypothetical protein
MEEKQRVSHQEQIQETRHTRPLACSSADDDAQQKIINVNGTNPRK